MEFGALDLHKKESQIQRVTERGEELDRRIATTRERFTALFEGRRPMRMVLEASTESERVVPHFETLGHGDRGQSVGPMYIERRRRVKAARRDVARWRTRVTGLSSRGVSAIRVAAHGAVAPRCPSRAHGQSTHSSFSVRQFPARKSIAKPLGILPPRHNLASRVRQNRARNHSKRPPGDTGAPDTISLHECASVRRRTNRSAHQGMPVADTIVLEASARIRRGIDHEGPLGYRVAPIRLRVSARNRSRRPPWQNPLLRRVTCFATHAMLDECASSRRGTD